jgi:CofD-related protein of GAK system
MASAWLTRAATIPDPLRVARYRRAPELGPRVLFFSGGTALRETSQVLTDYTHNSFHLITPFDSGGSSATLRRAFGMIAVGDLRNRLLALADRNVRGHPAIYRLFAYRFPATGRQEDLRDRLDRLVRDDDPLVDAVPNPMRRIIANHLSFFLELAPRDFDLRRASVGNLILTGGYFNQGRDIDAVTFTFSKLVEARGLVRPVVDADLHLRAELADGRVVFGQHRLTGKESAPITSPVLTLGLARAQAPDSLVDVGIDSGTRRFIAQAELICFPIGSLYSSLVACLLPLGVGGAVAEAGCPKVYIPNCGTDPEQIGLPPADAVERLLAYLRRSGAADAPTDRLLNFVIVDSAHGDYAGGLDIARIRKLGVEVIDTPLLADPEGARLLDARHLVEALLSLV